jgi:hypothetical protein
MPKEFQPLLVSRGIDGFKKKQYGALEKGVTDYAILI